MKITIAGFYRPPILAMRQLFSMGLSPDDVLLLTYDVDEDSEVKGRNQELLSFAKERGVAYVTDPITDKHVVEQVEAFESDILFSLFYRDKIPMSVLDELPYGGVNLHGSLLPRHKGRFPVSYAISEGDSVTGFTYHYMTQEFDEGPIVLQDEIKIEPNDTAYSLYHRLIYAAMRRFPEVYKRVVVEKIPGKPQPEGGNYNSRLPHENRIDPSWTDDRIDRFIRSMYFPPYRPAVVTVDGEEHEIVSMAQYRRIVGADE